MSANNNDLQSLNGLFKNVYADKLEQLIPDGVKLYKMIDFLPQEKQPGGKYVQSVILGGEHGITYGSSDDDVMNLNPPVAGAVKPAEVSGNPKCMRSVLGYTSTSRAAAKGPQAFESATKYVIANLLKSMHKRLEIECFYGQDNIGILNANPSGQDLVVSQASWAPGIWAGSENMPVEIRSSAGVLRGPANVAGVDLSTRTITLDSMPAGAASGDYIYFKGAYGKEFAGIKKITTNSSTLFGIDASQYSLWNGNSYAVGGLLSLEKIELAVAKAVEKGLDSDVVCFVNPSVFSILVADEAALRKYDASYKPEMGENGFSKLKFHAINGAITIEPSIYVKIGDAFMFNPKEFIRVGSSDVTLKRPGAPDQFMKELENSTGFELRAWCDLALFTAFPGHSVYLSGITLS